MLIDFQHVLSTESHCTHQYSLAELGRIGESLHSQLVRQRRYLGCLCRSQNAASVGQSHGERYLAVQSHRYVMYRMGDSRTSVIGVHYISELCHTVSCKTGARELTITTSNWPGESNMLNFQATMLQGVVPSAYIQLYHDNPQRQSRRVHSQYSSSC